mmetsp:Transcript_25405/g.60521  ORF Transcript_25405/g.60521 Transcript_25405/m.60521 type:complete len:93 (+) Transcript_25405:54-332(+)
MPHDTDLSQVPIGQLRWNPWPMAWMVGGSDQPCCEGERLWAGLAARFQPGPMGGVWARASWPAWPWGQKQTGCWELELEMVRPVTEGCDCTG